MILAAYPKDEAETILVWENDLAVVQSVCQIACDIQDEMPPRPGQCRYWTAVWVARVRDVLGLPAIQVGGDLHAFSECVYRIEDDRQFIDPSRPAFDRKWPGHSWFSLGTWIGDISMVYTSRTPTCQRELSQVVESHFRNSDGIVRVPFFARESAESFDLCYTPRGVYSPASVQRNIEVGKIADQLGVK